VTQNENLKNQHESYVTEYDKKYKEIINATSNDMLVLEVQKDHINSEWEVKLKIAVDEAVLKESEES
jgi:hypothetical protein